MLQHNPAFEFLSKYYSIGNLFYYNYIILIISFISKAMLQL